MKSILFKYLKKRLNIYMVALAVVALFAGLSACNKDTFNPYLMVAPEDVLRVSNSETSSFIEVRTNAGEWIFLVSGGDWVSGTVTDKGIQLSFQPNPTSAERSMNVTVRLAYNAMTRNITVTQAPSYITVASELEIPAAGGTINVPVHSNVSDWECSLKDGTWISELSKTADGVSFTAAANDVAPAAERKDSLFLSSPSFPQLSKKVLLIQSPN